MQRALFSRSALLAQQAAAALDSPLTARSAPLLQRLDRSMSSVSIPPPACMLRPLEAPLRYLFGPGPSNVPPRILAAGGRPIIGHLHAEMYEVNDKSSLDATLTEKFRQISSKTLMELEAQRNLCKYFRVAQICGTTYFSEEYLFGSITCNARIVYDTKSNLSVCNSSHIFLKSTTNTLISTFMGTMFMRNYAQETFD